MAWGKPVAQGVRVQPTEILVQSYAKPSSPKAAPKVTNPTTTSAQEQPTAVIKSLDIETDKPEPLNATSKPNEISTSSGPVKPSGPISWSTLFKNNSSSTTNNQRPQPQKNTKMEVFPMAPSTSASVVTNGHADSHPSVEPVSIDGLRMLGHMFKQCELKHSAPALQPRGIRNKQNWCYINAVSIQFLISIFLYFNFNVFFNFIKTLQALLACPPLYNLIKSIFQKIKSSNQNMKSVPCIAAL